MGAERFKDYHMRLDLNIKLDNLCNIFILRYETHGK